MGDGMDDGGGGADVRNSFVMRSHSSRASQIEEGALTPARRDVVAAHLERLRFRHHEPLFLRELGFLLLRRHRARVSSVAAPPRRGGGGYRARARI
jgi:hypothetical protein